MSSSEEEEEFEQVSSHSALRRVSTSGESKRKKRKKSKRNHASSSEHQDENNNNNKRHTTGIENQHSKRKKHILNGIDDKNETISVEEVNKICHDELKFDDCDIVEAALRKLEGYHEYKVYHLDGTLIADNLLIYVSKYHLIPCITGSVFRFLEKAHVLRQGLFFFMSFSSDISNLPVTTDSLVAAIDLVVQSMEKYSGDECTCLQSCLILRNVFLQHNQSVQMAGNNMGVLKSILGAMKKHPENETIQSFGCCVLRIFYEDMDEQQTMKDTSCLSILVKAMNHNSSKVRNDAAKLMQQISSDIVSDTEQEA